MPQATAGLKRDPDTRTKSFETEIAPPPLEIYIDPGSANAETIRDVLRAVSDLYAALGGEGLDFGDEAVTVLGRGAQK